MANIGIDLGTTNSLVAVVMGGKARCLLDDDGRALLPSAVRYTADGVLVGYPALDGAAEHAASTLTSVKRFMGRGMDEARADAHHLHYALSADESDNKIVRIQLPERTVTPIEVSAEILKALRERAVDCLMNEPGGAVITVPAYFDDAQRQATRDAGRIAGLNVLRLLNEPTAAAIAYGLQEHSQGVYAVYDLGGGTFDISILRLEEGVFQVLSTAGDTHLGGDDFDQLLAARILAELGIVNAKGGVLRRAIELAEQAKRALSAAESTTVEGNLDGHAVNRVVTRAEFEALIAPTVERTLVACRQAMTDAELREVDGVVLVGGSTRVPLVRQKVEQFFGKRPFCDIDPDQVVALGAAMQADILTGESQLAEDVLLMDVVPLSLGLETMGGVVEKLIWRCSPIPASASETFTTHVDGQTAVDVHVLQGERELASDCRSLARFKLRGIPAMPAGLPRIKVEFIVDADGILTVVATEQYTGTQAQVEVVPAYGIDDDEIERMLEESIDFAETDVDKRMLIEARVEAEQILNAVQKALAVDPALLLDGEAQKIQSVVDALRAAMSGEERRKISELSKKLDEVSAPFAQRRIERDLQLALRGQDALAVAEKLARPTAS